MIGNGFVLQRREQLEVLGHQRGEFVTIAREVVQDLLNRRAKLRKGRVEAIAGDFALQELPESLDQIEIGRVRRQIEQVDAAIVRRIGDRIGMVVRGIVEYH